MATKGLGNKYKSQSHEMLDTRKKYQDEEYIEEESTREYDEDFEDKTLSLEDFISILQGKLTKAEDAFDEIVNKVGYVSVYENKDRSLKYDNHREDKIKNSVRDLTESERLLSSALLRLTYNIGKVEELVSRMQELPSRIQL